MNKLKFKVIKVDSKIKYIPIDLTEGGGNLGRAEFEFYPVFKHGKMIDLFIIRRQQINKEHYHLPLKKLGFNNTKSFNITSWSHLTDSPKIWQNYWCKELKTICFRVYVPNDTNLIEFDYHFGDSLTIRFVKGDDE